MSKQTIYNRLRSNGLSEAGALALMGNFEAESGNEACRLQGDYQSSRESSKAYAQAVDGGSMSRDTFARDGKGWGLAQWTFRMRKATLYDFCKGRGASIADEAAQVDFAIKELRESYPSLCSFLCSCATDQLYTATDRVCREYEQPAINNVKARFNAAKKLRETLALDEWGQTPAAPPDPDSASEETPVDTPATPFWPPRMLTLGMIGSDVAVLQALLIARGHDPGSVDGVLGLKTQAAMWEFQGITLGVTGDFGTKSWTALLSVTV